jgi:peptidyl-prolyl cis-trans isomerase C
MKKSLGLALLLGILLGGAGGAMAADQGKPGDVLVKMDKQEITRGDFEARIAGLPAEYQSRFKTDQQKREFLDMIVQGTLLASEARAGKLDKDKSVAMRLSDATNSILAQEYLKRLFDALPKVTDADVAKYYEGHTAEFKTPEMVNAQHILIKTEQDAGQPELTKALDQAKQIKAELDKGADFAKLAEKYSDDPGSKSKGGELGFFARDRMVPEFSQVAFALGPGQISEPVKSRFGFHIIRVIERREAKQLDLKEAAPRIKALVENQRRKEAADREIEKLKKKYNVTYSAGMEPKK